MEDRCICYVLRIYSCMMRVGLLWGGVCVLFRCDMSGYFEEMWGGRVWAGVCGWWYAFHEIRGAGVCKRTGTVKFHILPVRNGT